jgi:hypothetical protein
MEPLTFVVSFDVSEQVALGSIACWIADLVNKFGFHGSKVALCMGALVSGSSPARFQQAEPLQAVAGRGSMVCSDAAREGKGEKSESENLAHGSCPKMN